MNGDAFSLAEGLPWTLTTTQPRLRWASRWTSAARPLRVRVPGFEGLALTS